MGSMMGKVAVGYQPVVISLHHGGEKQPKQNKYRKILACTVYAPASVTVANQSASHAFLKMQDNAVTTVVLAGGLKS